MIHTGSYDVRAWQKYDVLTNSSLHPSKTASLFLNMQQALKRYAAYKCRLVWTRLAMKSQWNARKRVFQKHWNSFLEELSLCKMFLFFFFLLSNIWFLCTGWPNKINGKVQLLAQPLTRQLAETWEQYNFREIIQQYCSTHTITQYSNHRDRLSPASVLASASLGRLWPGLVLGLRGLWLGDSGRNSKILYNLLTLLSTSFSPFTPFMNLLTCVSNYFFLIIS